MKCDKCGSEPFRFILFQIAQPDGRLETILCTECMRKQGLYCVLHATPKQLSWDGSAEFALCKGCLSEKMSAISRESALKEFREALAEKYEMGVLFITEHIAYYAAAHPSESLVEIRDKITTGGFAEIFYPARIPVWVTQD